MIVSPHAGRNTILAVPDFKLIRRVLILCQAQDTTRSFGQLDRPSNKVRGHMRIRMR